MPINWKTYKRKIENKARQDTLIEVLKVVEVNDSSGIPLKLSEQPADWVVIFLKDEIIKCLKG